MVNWQGKWVYSKYVGQSKSGKTEIWVMVAVADDTPLGQVYWYASWRQYAFYPAEHTLWNADCLDEVSGFVRSLTVEHRAKRLALSKR